MVLLLWLVIFVEICFVIYKKCAYEKSKIEINHIFMFSLGFVFYYMIPIIVLNLGLFQDGPGMSGLYFLYKNIHYKEIIKLLLSMFGIYNSFILGNFIVEKFVKEKKKKNKKANKFNIKILLFANIPMLAYFLFVFRKSFLKGNLGELNSSSLRGTFVAYSLVFLAFALFYTAYRYEKNTFIEKVSNSATIIYFVLSILLLSMGGRLYFISSIFMFLVFRSVFFEKIKISNLFIGLLTCIIGSGAYGIIRMGIFKIRLSDILFNVLAESLYTSYSMMSFLSYNNVLKAFQIPKYLFSNLISVIPRAILPNKEQFFIDPLTSGYSYIQPYGATNTYVPFSINFGFLGVFVAFFMIGVFMAWLKKKNNELSMVIYIMISGFLGFTFFRDNFDVSLVKNIFEFSIISPIIIYLICKVKIINTN